MGRLLHSYTFVAASYSILIAACASTGTTDSSVGPGGTPGGGVTGAGGVNPGSNATGPIIELGDKSNCGNGRQDENEQCDDSNPLGGDGCSVLCQLEADSNCPVWGQPCTTTAVCGDGLLSSVEACDDKNAVAGDGCAADCKTVETGWQCRVPGKGCTPICGDGVITPPENCDQGGDKAVGDDGCSVTCLKEPGYSCTGTPSVCTAAVCGNGVVETGESCDLGVDNGLFHGDAKGCSKTCTQEPLCRDAAGLTTACVTRCGDGNIDTVQGEECDDSNGVPGDGCSTDCKLEGGFTCTPKVAKDAQPCKSGTGDCLQLPITYRDFDGANLASGHPDFLYYGSTPAGGTKTVCVPNSSGIPARARTDGGTCWAHDATALCLGLTKPDLDTDGKPAANAARAGGLTCPCRYTDWDGTGILAGLTTTTEYTVDTCNAGAANPTRIDHKGVKIIQSAASFKQWYADSTFSTKSVGFLELSPQAGSDNTYQFTASNGRTLYDDIHDLWLAATSKPAVSTPPATSLTSGWFPLNNATGPHSTKICNLWPYWGLSATEASSCVRKQYDQRADTDPNKVGAEGAEIATVQGVPRNYYFTTEARYLFRYKGGEVLAFHGDDDVWVYVNGKLVLDMGSTHERLEGTVTLSATGANAVLRSQDVVTQVFTQVGTAQTTGGLGLVEGNTYEIAIFHADHHPRDSNYQLTLTGFSRTFSECAPTCGDNVATVGEECDLGAANQDGLYGGCSTKCLYGPFCGDGVKDATEDCDLGTKLNTGAYGVGGCTPACKTAHFCGDAILDSAFGEGCDVGPSGSSNCGTDCKVILQ